MAIKPEHWQLDNFAGGLDTREGQFSKKQNAFRELTNYTLTVGKKLRRRAPYRLQQSACPANSQGLAALGGALKTVQRYDQLTALGVVAGLGFDTPEGCTAAWELIDHAVFEDKLIAIIRHSTPNIATPFDTRIHVLGGPRSDGATYVEDPEAPSHWRGGRAASPKLANYLADWQPRIRVAYGKVYINGPDGNVYFCKTGNPRAWNTRSIVSLTETGKIAAWMIPATGSTLKTFTASENFEDFQLDTLRDQYRFTAYVFEWYSETNDTWNVMAETRASPTADKTFRIVATANRWGNPDTEAKIELRWTSAPVPVRLRTILSERTNTLTGDVVSFAGQNVSMALGSHEIITDGVTVEYDTAAFGPHDMTGQSAGWILAGDDGQKNAYGDGTPSTVSVVTSTPTGYQRWLNHVVAYLHNDGAGTWTSAPMSLDEAWQGVRKIALALYAGEGDAGFINTSAHTGAAGTPVTALAVLRQHLLVFYRQSTQLWSIGALVSDHFLVDQGNVGTGDQPTPEPAPLDNTSIVATPQGLRQYGVEALQVAYLTEIGVADPLRRLSPDTKAPTQLAAVFWPRTGQYVTCVSLNGETFFLCYDHQLASEIAGWSKWTVRGLNAPQRAGMVAIDDKLYVRSGNELYAFDASATTFRDSTDIVGRPAYESRAVWPFNDFKRPGTNKSARYIDVSQVGTGSFALRYNPQDERYVSGPVPIPGPTYGKGKVPFVGTGPALSLVLTSTDETGHELQAVAIELSLRSR